MPGFPVRLEDLIDHVVEHAPDAEALDHLAIAVVVSTEVDEVTDHLIGHFVDQARRSGASWTEIGRRMGVTKQAVQKRFVPRVDALGGLEERRLTERFTDRARRVVLHAQEEARLRGSSNVGSVDIVLGLLDEPGALAARAIDAQGVSHDAIRAAAAPAAGGRPDDEPIRFGRDARKLLQLTAREALRLGHNYVGSEHILLAALRDKDSPGARVLIDNGVDRTKAEAWIRAQLDEIHRRGR